MGLHRVPKGDPARRTGSVGAWERVWGKAAEVVDAERAGGGKLGKTMEAEAEVAESEVADLREALNTQRTVNRHLNTEVKHCPSQPPPKKNPNPRFWRGRQLRARV